MRESSSSSEARNGVRSHRPRWLAMSSTQTCAVSRVRRRCLKASSLPRPAERMGLVQVSVLDEGFDLVPLVVQGAEVAVAKNAPVKDGEPDLDLVHPRGV